MVTLVEPSAALPFSIPTVRDNNDALVVTAWPPPRATWGYVAMMVVVGAGGGVELLPESVTFRFGADPCATDSPDLKTALELPE